MRGNELIGILFVFGTVAYAIVTLVRMLLDHLRRTKTERLQADIYNKMLDKFGSSQELLTYLQTDSGQGLLKAPPVEQPAPYGRILNSVQLGVVVTALGIGVLLLHVNLGDRDSLIAGSLILALGIGLLMAGVASWLLSRSFGLIQGKP